MMSGSSTGHNLDDMFGRGYIAGSLHSSQPITVETPELYTAGRGAGQGYDVTVL